MVAFFVAGRDSNPWSLHRNIWLHLLFSCELFCFGLPLHGYSQQIDPLWII